jgi:hypothetical protein
MLIWFTATVLGGRRERFAFGALVAALVMIAALIVANPDAIVANANVARAGSAVPFDASYAARLSADAAPALVRALPELPAESRCRVAASLLDRWGSGPRPDWRNWSVSGSGARRLVAETRSTIASAALAVRPCPDPSD